MIVRWKWWALFLGLAAVYFVRLGSRALWDPDEGRYAEIAHEMLATGNWLTPRFNGAVYLEKPPLLYWAMASVWKLCGIESRWLARLPMAAATLMTCLLIAWRMRRRLGDVAAFWGTLAYGFSLFVFLMSHIVLIDSVLALPVAGAFAALDWGRDRKGWGPPLLLGVSVGLGILAKGPVAAVIPALGVALECLFTWSLQPFLSIRRLAFSVIVCLAVALPWFVLEQRAVPEFLGFFIVHEHLQRFATEEAARPGPWWIFALLAVAGWSPWWGELWAGIRGGWGEPSGLVRRGLAWAAGVILFFSASRSKLPHYVWPAFPLMAFAVGWGCKAVWEGRARAAWRTGRVLTLLLGLGLALMSHPVLRESVYGDYAVMAPAGLVAGIAMALLATVSLFLDRPALLFVALSFLGVQAWIFRSSEALNDVKSSRDLARRILADDRNGGAVIVNHRGFRPSLSYYATRRIVQWGSPGELRFGMSLLPPAERDFWFLNTKDDRQGADRRMQALWGGPERVYLVIRAADEEAPGIQALKPKPSRICTVGEDAVLVNR